MLSHTVLHGLMQQAVCSKEVRAQLMAKHMRTRLCRPKRNRFTNQALDSLRIAKVRLTCHVRLHNSRDDVDGCV